MGISLNNTVSNKLSNLLPVNVADPGVNGNLDGMVEYNGATISIDPDVKIFGDASVLISTPGSQLDEGIEIQSFDVLSNEIYSILLGTGGGSDTTLEAFLVEKDSDGNVIGFERSGYYNYDNSENFIPLTRTVTVGTKLSVIIATGYTPQATTFVYGGGMLVTGSTPPSPYEWIPGQTSIQDNSVTVTEVEAPPSNYIRGGMVEDNVATAHPEMYPLIKESGCTDLWYLDHQLQANNTLSKSQLETNLAEIEDSDLKFHFCVLPFVAEGGTAYADPSDLTYRSWFLSRLEEILIAYPRIDGVSLNDYLYPDSFWDTSTIDARLQNRQDLIDFATAVRDLAHQYNKIFSINILPVTSHDAYIEDLAPICDYIMPEIYRGMGTAPTGVSLQMQHKWFKEVLEDNLNRAGVNNVLPSIITYDYYRDENNPLYNPNEPEYPTEDIIQDINIVFDHPTCIGYALCEFGYSPADLYLPDGRAYTNPTTTRITTQGKFAGEGIKLTPSLVAAETIIKIPKNKTLGFYLNTSDYVVITGTGEYQTLDEFILPTDHITAIATDDIEGITYYICDKEITTAQVDYGTEIRERLPEDHIINNDPENPGRILIDKSIGKYFAQMEVDIFKNSRGRFLPFATGINLERYGDWFGIQRNGMDDNTYRANIISLISADITIAGVKTAVSAILNIDETEIDISNSIPNIAKAGSKCKANNYTGIASKFGGYFAMQKKQITITVPTGTDISILQSVIKNLVLPGVQVTIDNGYIAPE